MKTLLNRSPKIDSSLIFLSILLTILSQYPLLVENNSGYFLRFIWILLFIRIATLRKLIIDRYILVPFLIYSLFIIFSLSGEAFSGNLYLKNPLLNNISMMLFIMFLGYCSASIVSENEFSQIVFWTCLIGGIILSFGIYITSFLGVSDIFNREYVYLSKNSASQIIFSCVVYCLLIPNSQKVSIIKYPALAFMVYLIIILRSRATILGFVILLLILVFKSKNKIFRISSFLLILSVVIALFLSEKFYTLLISRLISGGANIYDLDDMSSGRIIQYQRFPQLFLENMFFGRGYYYMESFPLAIVIQYGIIGAFIILSFLLWVFSFIRVRLYYSNNLDLCVMILFYCYLLNSLFEEQAPFGPGVKSFLFWLAFGFVMYKRVRGLSRSYA
jgi:O-antigen ligase